MANERVMNRRTHASEPPAHASTGKCDADSAHRPFSDAVKGKHFHETMELPEENGIVKAAGEAIAGAAGSAKMKAYNAVHAPKHEDEALVRKFESQAYHVAGRMRHLRFSEHIDGFIDQIGKPAVLVAGALGAGIVFFTGLAGTLSTGDALSLALGATAAAGIWTAALLVNELMKDAFDLLAGGHPTGIALKFAGDLAYAAKIPFDILRFDYRAARGRLSIKEAFTGMVNAVESDAQHVVFSGIVALEDSLKLVKGKQPERRLCVPFTRRCWTPANGGYWNTKNANREVELAIDEFLPTLEKTITLAELSFHENKVKHILERLRPMKDILMQESKTAKEGGEFNRIRFHENELFEPARELAHRFKDGWNPKIAELRAREAAQLKHANGH